MDDKTKIKELAEENAKLKEELQSTKEHLKKYTAPASSKVYYEKHMEEQKQRVKEYQQRTNYKSDDYLTIFKHIFFDITHNNRLYVYCVLYY